MKAMKRRILEKLRSLPRLGSLKTSPRVLRLNASDVFSSAPSPPGPCLHLVEPPNPRRILRELPWAGNSRRRSGKTNTSSTPVSERPLPPPNPTSSTSPSSWGIEDDDGDDLNDISCDKENIGPTPSPPMTKDRTPPTPDKEQPFSFHGGSRGRRPRAPSAPNLSLLCHPVRPRSPPLLRAGGHGPHPLLRRGKRRSRRRKRPKGEANRGPPGELQAAMPAGGGDAVLLYTRSLRGIRKTFEDCNSVRLPLSTLRVRFFERDVSMYRRYIEELWGVLGGRVMPPRLLVRGRYVGGADEVVGLHEHGRLLPLFWGLTSAGAIGGPGRACGGDGFVVCRDWGVQ